MFQEDLEICLPMTASPDQHVPATWRVLTDSKVVCFGRGTPGAPVETQCMSKFMKIGHFGVLPWLRRTPMVNGFGEYVCDVRASKSSYQVSENIAR